MLNIFTATDRFRRGQSYWRVTLLNGKTINEGQITFDFARGTRNVGWLEDIVRSGDCERIRTLTLCTPEGEVTLPILEPCTAFQLQRGTSSLFTGENIANCQIIGRVDDRQTGACTAVIWDVQAEKHLYIDHFTSVKDFKPWRPGVANVGALSYSDVGLRSIGGVL